MRSIAYLSVIGFSILAAPAATLACSSCGCSFNSDWASEGYSNCGGVRFDVRFDYIDQDELRSGSSSVSESELLSSDEHHDEHDAVKHSGSHDEEHSDEHVDEHAEEMPATEDHVHGDEVQDNTRTKQTTFSFDYSPNSNWGIKLVAPYINRSHSTYANGSAPLSKSETSGFGDVQVIARHEGFSSLEGLGVEFGLKLPTGSFDENFDSGPLTGEPIDRGLQNGTGTTDLILGAYKFGKYSELVEYFFHLTAQQPFAKRDDFALGTALTASSGVAYKVTDRVRPQLQLNFRHEEREVGLEADADNSGGDFLYISPGITISPSEKIKVYAVVQLPAYQKVNGVQLHPDAIYSAGIRYSF